MKLFVHVRDSRGELSIVVESEKIEVWIMDDDATVLVKQIKLDTAKAKALAAAV